MRTLQLLGGASERDEKKSLDDQDDACCASAPARCPAACKAPAAAAGGKPWRCRTSLLPGIETRDARRHRKSPARRAAAVFCPPPPSGSPAKHRRRAGAALTGSHRTPDLGPTETPPGLHLTSFRLTQRHDEETGYPRSSEIPQLDETQNWVSIKRSFRPEDTAETRSGNLESIQVSARELNNVDRSLTVDCTLTEM